MPDSHLEWVNVLELMEQRAAGYAELPVFRFLSASGSETSVLTFGETAQRARAIAARLQGEAKPGARVLLPFPPGPEFVCAFLGCLTAGMTAVPVFPPDPRNLNTGLSRLRPLILHAQPHVVLSESLFAALSGQIRMEIPILGSVPWLNTEEIDVSTAAHWRRPSIEGRSVALLQYTSGSTASPRGVLVAHGNLLANLRDLAIWGGLRREMQLDFGDRLRSVCWLPFYHDMGLISGILLTVYCAGETAFIHPLDFARRPLLWLDAMSRYRANMAGGPNFAYALCVRRTTWEQREQLDLSHWAVAFCGAEAVREKTLAEFGSAFACAGFRRESFAPCYGLAEATLMVTMTPHGRGAAATEFDTAALENGLARPAGPQSTRRVPLVSCGPPATGSQVRIVDPDNGEPVPEGRIGEVWVRGSSVALGYWRPDEIGALAFDCALPDGETGFVRTGDLGFLYNGELHVTGRCKDVIIIHGRNHSPADIEETAGDAHASIRPGCCAAFSVDGEEGERLVIAAEVAEAAEELQAPAIYRAAREAVIERHGVTIGELVLLPRRAIPRTSSGKIQRHAVQGSYVEGVLDALCVVTSTASEAREAT